MSCVARERPTGGRVLVGPVVGQRRHHLPGLVAVPRVEVPVQGRVDAHAHTFALRPGRINYDPWDREGSPVRLLREA